MRRFMKTSAALKDVRIAYLLLSFVSLALCFLGVAAERSERELARLETAELRASIAECADALRSVEAARTSDERLGAVLRFELASAGLGCSDSAALELRRVAGLLREGGRPPDGLAETLERLAVSELGDDPYRSVSEALAPAKPPAPVSKPKLTGSDERWLLAKAREASRELLGEASLGLELTHRGDELTGGCRNLRVSFSDYGPTLRELIFIRLGADLGRTFTEPELCERASGLLGGDATLEGSLGGLTLYRAEGGVAVLDGAGRLWALLPER